MLSASPVRFYEGVVELCLTAADKKDPQKLGPHFYKNGEPEEDAVGQQAFQERCVKNVFFCLFGFSLYCMVFSTFCNLTLARCFSVQAVML